MKIFTLALVVCGFCISAQNFTYMITDYKNGTPSSLFGVPGDQFKRTVTFTNPTSAAIYIHIKRTQKTTPQYWSQWCHYLQHFSPSQDTLTVKVSAYSSSTLTVHFKTDSIQPGIASANFRMFQTGLEDDAETFNMAPSTIKKTDVGISNEEQLNEIMVFPNPASQFLNIVATDKNINAITIYDALGVEVFKADSVASVHAIDISAYPAGMYVVKIADGNAACLRKIIKR